jgi:hypothetical protein
MNRHPWIKRHCIVEDLTDDEWKIVQERALRRELATEAEVEAVFSRYRNPLGS